VVIILVVVVLMSAFLVLRCLSFDQNGAHVKDRYGILAAEGSRSELVDYSRYAEGSVLETSEEDETPPSDDEEKEERRKELIGAPDEIRAIVVTPKDLTYDDDYLNQVLALAASGTLDTVIVDLKDDQGNVSVQISTTALDSSTVQTVYSDEFPDAIAQLKAAGIRVIGRIYAFRDNMATRQNNDLSCWYASASTNWLDAEDNRWLDPTDTAVIQYLCDIVTKGVEIGCDEFLLAQFSFPEGATDLISYDNPGNPQTIIPDDFEKIQEAAGDIPVSLYVENPTEDRSAVGQDLSVLEDMAYRLVASPLSIAGTEDDSAMSTMTDAIAERAGTDLKVTPVYTGRENWQASYGTAIYDPQGDIYQLFYLQ
jgi:hypothetical protein